MSAEPGGAPDRGGGPGRGGGGVVALPGRGGSGLGGGAPRGWGEGPSREGRARAGAGSAARGCPRFWGTFGGVCASTRPTLPAPSRVSDGRGRRGLPTPTPPPSPLPPGSAETLQLKGTDGGTPASPSAPAASPSLSGCFPPGAGGRCRVPAGEQSLCPCRRRGAAGASVPARPWAGEAREERRGLAWLGFPSARIYLMEGKRQDGALCPRFFVRLVAFKASCGCAKAAVPSGDGFLPGLRW